MTMICKRGTLYVTRRGAKALNKLAGLSQETYDAIEHLSLTVGWRRNQNVLYTYP